ncbi:thioester domain-containing protein [Actinokineospora iranica]|uniref:LPXTG-motif cell wall anchor domain-containing protein/TQXA domain-containing protein n=1 Tax=Actinokineospora iranica TaxID=1271860 RepID=A0A1G6NYT5_9PSEU|nr:thioester domain-containing protein [Actinokineospora iranica]SDC73103.1 LPXTG-motif cell wall anchor domain-containing protein/TQXA domain-containing protein [Actinokineospora iranica]
MGSRWKLGRVGATLAAAAVLASVAALPAAAEEAARGRLQHEKTEGFGVRFENKQDVLQASLLHLKLTDGKMLKVYCVEINVDASHDQDMVEVPWDAYPDDKSPFNANRDKINWVLHNGFPNKSIEELNGLGLNWGEAGLEVEEAITATQAAIWHFSDGYDINRNTPVARGANVETGQENRDADQDVLALYDYLISDANKGIGEQTVGDLKISPEKQSGEAGELVGPYEVTTNGEITELRTDLPEGVVLTDAKGNEIQAGDIENGTEVYVKVPADAEAGEGSFDLTADSPRIEIGRLFVGDDYANHKAQSLIVADSETVKLTAQGHAEWQPVKTVAPAQTAIAPANTSAAVAPAASSAAVAPAAQATTGDLPDTGASILLPGLIGLVLLAAGAGTLLYLRHRRSA